MTLRIPIGFDDFRRVREDKLEYIDKTDLIRQVIDRSGVQVLLLPRPRRFGKSMNLSMLRYWFEKNDESLAHLFQDLSIWSAGDEYRTHFQKYPVIYFNFKESKHAEFDAVMDVIKKKIESLFLRYEYLLHSDRLSEWQIRDFRSIIDRTASIALYERALLDLSTYLHTHHGERVIILIDEYDEPIHAAHVHGFSAQMLQFMRSFLGAALKSNVHLFKSVITGILRVAKENLFSGLNNIAVYSLLDKEFNTCFGFTDDEVTSLLERANRIDRLADTRAWYNGYLFGGEIIYNPWSILSYLEREDSIPKPYWVGTSSNELVHELLGTYAIKVEHVFEELLEGRSIEAFLDENVVLGELHTNDAALWSLLVFSGYLKADPMPYDSVVGKVSYRLSIPNREVREVYSSTFQRWIKSNLTAQGGDIGKLARAMLSGDTDTFEDQLQRFVQNILSYYDIAKLDPERVYHGFVLGLLAALEPEFIVRSNRESGAGRPDVMIRPRLAGKPGVLLELKLARKGKKTPAAALREGLAQIRSKGYAADLWATGVSEVHAFAVAFDGKRVWIKSSEAGDKKKGKGKK
ncbi:MAG TPA: AAA family ATPase [Polyangium sp.]|nr:AAA family ATPase [Polyangium sp.]